MKSSSVKAIVYLGVQLNFCLCFLYLLSHLGEIPYKKFAHNAVCSCLLLQIGAGRAELSVGHK
jgi:hypothetical protein